MRPVILKVILVTICGCFFNQPAPATEQGTNPIAQSVAISGVHNSFRASTNIYSGNAPENDAAFAAIAKLGVKTIISVDGSKPDVTTAQKYGLRYIHLPYGYDGIPTNRVAELAKVATTEPGPFYVHCHHGKHRGPAAVAVMCLSAAGWTTNQAVAWLREAGTADDYPGLYRAAREFKAPTTAELAAVKELPEIAKSTSLVEAMVAIDAHLDALKLSQQAGWKTPPQHADISPAHEATLLWEQFREIARLKEMAERPEDYREKNGAAEQAAEILRKLLREPADNARIDATFKQLGQSCVACHQKYRNE